MYTSKHILSGSPLALAAAFILFMASCISNDLPYPWVQPVVTTFDVASTDAEGHPLLSSPTEIDSAARTVTIHLSEWADITNVPLSSYTLSDGSELISPSSIPSGLNLTEPLILTLGLYERTYDWTIRATQDIERYFTIRSQISASVIDPVNLTVKALVPTGQPLDAIRVLSIKLGGESAVMSPDLSGSTVDFTEPVKVDVTEFGRTSRWTLTVEQTDVSVTLDRIDPWTCVTWLYASAESGKQNGFEYRLASADEWTVVPSAWITVDGGSMTACLRHLLPQTTYVARAISGDEHSAELSFTTGMDVQLPNSQFTDWSQSGSVWNPWAEGDENQFWDTGNRGAATLGSSNTIPFTDATGSTGYAGAVLQTKFVGVGMLGKLASGNLFAGKYVRTDGTNGILAFGRPFTQRPTAIKARIKYTNVPITHASASNPNLSALKGEPDTCIVWCALGDWDEPYEIRTKPSERRLFERDNPGVIAYGEITSGNPISDFTDVIIPLEYNATNRVPTYLLLTASASKYGDYFTGGNGSVLTILSYELLYDYDY